MGHKDPTFLPHNVKDETGNVYGKLTVIAFAGLYNKYARWLCQCECGKTVNVRGTILRYGNHKSCGCGHYKANGLYYTPEHRTWSGMITRCTNPKNKRWANYGGRGIAVCDRWRRSFLHFYKDMGPKPGPEYSIDRINNDGNYEPDNCRWATRSQQARNSRRAVLLTYNGDTLCTSEWARRVGIKPATLAARIHRGWTVERAITATVT